VNKIFTAAALTVTALSASAGSAAAAPMPTGPAAFRALTGLVLPAPESTNGSSVKSGSGLLSMEDTNVVNLMSDHSRKQVTGTSGVQG
jgi:hypothetical protein